jgi:hypothetical protein
LVSPHQNLKGLTVAPLNALDAFRVTYFLSEHGLVSPIRRCGFEKSSRRS